jgi:predicted nucleotidyltransferase
MAVDENVLAHLESIRLTYNVTILHAVEVGSRAWGLANPQSDHDIGFIYVRPKHTYFQINQGHRDAALLENRDTLEIKVDGFGDLNGFDIEKATTLAYNSNPSIVDWLRLPEYYSTDHANRLRELMWKGFSTLKLRQQNVSILRRNYKTYVEPRPTVSVKKYLHTVRPLLNAIWFERTATFDLGTECPPVNYLALCNVAAYNHDLLEGCMQLLHLKLKGEERVQRIAGIDRVIEKMLESREIPQGLTRIAPDIVQYDRFFADVVLQQN